MYIKTVERENIYIIWSLMGNELICLTPSYVSMIPL